MELNRDIFVKRRESFMRKMDGGVSIFPSAPIALHSGDVEYKYRQDSDFYYLTGFAEPESICLLAPDHARDRFVLFVRPRHPEKEIWTGQRAGVEGAMELYGADMAYTIDKLEEVLSRYVEKAEKVYYAIGRDDRLNQKILDLVKHLTTGRARSGTGPIALIHPGEILHEMRLVKSPEELACMRHAVAIAAEGHRRAMRHTRPGMHEYEIEALVECTFRQQGAMGPAYPSIVASGPNATILHYHTNDRRMEAGELLLIDAGAEYHYYCSDITRTFPVARTFSPLQRRVYEVVLRAQQSAIAMIHPGMRVDDIHRRAIEVLTQGMVDVELLQGDVEKIIEKEEYRQFYTHQTSHWLGMDVHDVGKYKIDGESRRLEPGMVLTVEPGIYIPRATEEVDARWRGMGIRIEDDVLVTPQGHEVLTAAVPKNIDDIEELRQEG